MLGNTTMTDEGILKVMGEEAVGVYTAGWYAAGLDTPDNKKFVAGINAEYKHDPGFYTAGPYTALLIIEEALKTTGGKTDDARRLSSRPCTTCASTTGRSARCGSTNTARRFSTSTSARWRA